MIRLRRRLTLALCSSILVTSSSFSVSCHKREASLPPPVAHPTFPAAFDQALKTAYAEVRSHPTDPDAVRRVAKLYQANRFSAEAKSCYEVVKSLPGGLNAQDHYYLANLALNDGDLETAQTELRAVIKRDPSYLPARSTLAEALFKSGQSDAAAKEYQEILTRDSTHLQASTGLARIELQRGDSNAAIERLERTVAAHPETALGADLLAHELGQRGQLERAGALTKISREKHEPVASDPWMDLLLNDSFDGQALALRCEAYIMAGQIDLAVPLLARVEMLEPKSWIPHVLKGWYEGRARHFTEGVLEYTKALEVGGDPDKICPLITGLLIEGGKLSDAAELAAAFYKKEPDSVPILTAYADIAVRQGDEKTARVLLSRLLAKEPYLYLPAMNYANILWNAGEKDAAVPHLQRVAKVFPEDVACRGLLAEYFLGKSEPASAVPFLEQALPHVPADTPAQKRMQSMLLQAYAPLADAAAQRGDAASAVAIWEKMAKLVPSDLALQAALANGYVQVKQFKKAAAVLEQMSSRDSQNPTILLSLGDVVYQDGAAEAARNYWKRALELLAPVDKELRELLNARLHGQINPDTFK